MATLSVNLARIFIRKVRYVLLLHGSVPAARLRFQTRRTFGACPLGTSNAPARAARFTLAADVASCWIIGLTAHVLGLLGGGGAALAPPRKGERLVLVNTFAPVADLARSIIWRGVVVSVFAAGDTARVVGAICSPA
jgi:hypothetical protein